MKNCSLIISFGLLLIFSACSRDDNSPLEEIIEEEVTISLVDVEGNAYKTITIGNQVWMAENLKTTKYNDGTSIEDGENDNWSKEEGRFMWASTSDLNGASSPELAPDYFGAVYNYKAAASRKLAPEGWRIPTESDWNELMGHLKENQYEGIEGKALKSTTGWVSEGNGDNAFGFNQLASGYVDVNGTPKADGINSIMILLDQNDEFTYVSVNLSHNDSEVLVADNSTWIGGIVRCIKE